MKKSKIIIIGDGRVGESLAFALTIKGLGDELGLIDINEKKALGDALDLLDAGTFAKQKNIFKASYEDTIDADIVVICAGLSQNEGETRLELLNKNVNIIRDITKKVVNAGFNGIFLMATNPVDILSYVCLKESGFPKNKVIGSGTVLDTTRLRRELSDELKIDSRNVHAYIMGEHGDSSFAVWSSAYISSVPIKEWLYLEGYNNPQFILDKNELEVINKAYEIINLKGATYYGIALGLCKIIEAIIYDENCILTVSAYLEGEFYNHDVCTGCPAVINKEGIKKIVNLKLSNEEQIKMNKSVNIIKENIRSLNI